MPFLIRGFVDDNRQAQEVVTALGSIGLARERIQVTPVTDDAAEHRPDAVSAWSGSWGAFGLFVGGALGWLLLVWTPMPWIGALWGAVVGGICGARFGGYKAFDAVHDAGAPSGASEIRTEASSSDGAAAIERLYVDHGARAVVLERI